MQKSKIKVIDDFLPIHKFNTIRKDLESENFPWYWNSHSTGYDFTPQFVHKFMEGRTGEITSGYFEVWKSIGLFEQLDAHSVLKFKVNCNYKTHEQHVGNFHTDFLKEEGQDITTSIFYINTNNGGTKFEDGTIVNSVANRLITFDYLTEHAAVSCTDEDRRIVVNINYTKLKKIVN